MRRVLVVAALLFALGVGVRGVAGTTGAEKSFAAANDAWERGDYIPALNGYIALLNAPGGETLLEPIALTTGELFETRELTTDGRAPRFSPDGRFLVYETGLETSRRTKILKNDATRAEVADLAGVSATFSPQMTQVAYLKIPDNDEIRRASDALDRASLTARNRAQLTQTLTWLIAKHATIVVRDLNNGREMILPTPDLLKAGLTFSADGRSLYFLGGAEGEPDRNDLYVISEASPKPVLVVDAAGLKGVPTVDPSGAALLYVQVTPAQNPLREPGLVKQNHLRAYRNRTGDAQALLLATREAEAVCAEFILDLIPQGPPLQGLFNAAVYFGLRKFLVETDSEGDVLVDRHRKWRRLLEHHSDPGPQQVQIQPGIENVLAFEQYLTFGTLTGIQIVHAVENAKQR